MRNSEHLLSIAPRTKVRLLKKGELKRQIDRCAAWSQLGSAANDDFLLANKYISDETKRITTLACACVYYILVAREHLLDSKVYTVSIRVEYSNVP